MATWLSTIKDWVNGAVVTEANLDEEVRDRHSAMYDVVTADAYTGTGGDARIWHGHKSGTLASRPTAAHAGRLYYATDLGATFIDSGTRWDVAFVNRRLAAHAADEFMFSNILTTASSIGAPTGDLNWMFNNGGGTGNIATLGNTGATSDGELRLGTGLGAAGSTATLANGNSVFSYVMSARTPALASYRYATGHTTDATVLFGLADGGGATPNGIYFKRVDTGSVGNWFCVTRSGGSNIENVDTGVAGDTSYHWFEISIESTGANAVKFYIDGTLRATNDANAGLLTANLGHQHYIVNAAAVAKTLKMDYWEWIAKR